MRPSASIPRLRTGSRVDVHRLIVGELPTPLRRVKRAALAYRRGLEAACVDTHGEVTMMHAHHIDSAVSHEMHSHICRWLLNHRFDKMTTQEVINCSKAMSNAKADRNRAVRELRLAQDHADIIATLYAPRDEGSEGHATSEPCSDDRLLNRDTGEHGDADDVEM